MKDNQKYNVVDLDGSNGYYGLSLTQAIRLAKKERDKGNKVVIEWYRPSDGQHGYYNADEGHAITGQVY